MTGLKGVIRSVARKLASHCWADIWLQQPWAQGGGEAITAGAVMVQNVYYHAGLKAKTPYLSWRRMSTTLSKPTLNLKSIHCGAFSQWRMKQWSDTVPVSKTSRSAEHIVVRSTHRAADVTDDVLVVLDAETVDSANGLLQVGVTLHLKRLQRQLHCRLTHLILAFSNNNTHHLFTTRYCITWRRGRGGAYALSPVYTIQPVLKPVWQLVVLCTQTFNRWAGW